MATRFLLCVLTEPTISTPTGTFSSVYKAIDLQHEYYENDLWASRSPRSASRQGNVYVALKRIYVTSSPSRILNELEIMEELR